MRRTFSIFFYLFFSPSLVLGQQPSVIDQLIRIRPSLVEVIATNAAAQMDAPQQRSLVKDPNTGKVYLLEKGATVATYQRSGAGVILHSSGVIVTNAHTINLADRIEILLASGEKTNAQVVRFTTDLDLALLKISVPAPLQAVALADSSRILLNEEIFTVGNSPLLKESISGGRITGLASSQNAFFTNEYESDFFQTSLRIYKGDSGGPLFTRNGELVGLMTAKLMSKDNSSFAISSNKIRRYLESYLTELNP